jgi:subtilase family serine protease
MGKAKQIGVLPASQHLNLSIVLPLRNQGELTKLLSRLYDPSSPDYRHFLSVHQFTEQFGPTAEDYQKVVDFARAKGFSVKGASVNRLVVPVTGTVDQIQSAFNVTLRTYQHPTEHREFFSPDREPSVALSTPIAHVVGLSDYSLPQPSHIRPESDANLNSTVSFSGSGPGGAYVGSDMRAAYYGNGPLTGRGQAVALLQFDGYNIADVVQSFNSTAQASVNGNNYILTYTPASGGATHTVPINNVLLDGANGAPASGNDAEEVLDIVQSISMAPGLSEVRVYIGNNDSDILNAIASDNIAKQVSISWLWNPEDPEIDDFYFQEMAAQGQSVFVASGDYGAYQPEIPLFFPAEDAYVTAVGGTSLVTTGAGGAWSSETTWGDSGGGPSPDLIPLPSWQSGIATTSNQASMQYRNVPDVAMEADFDNYNCAMGSCFQTYGGTSFAAPRWAGYMALVNQQAANDGQPPIGFLNPLLYAIGQDSQYESAFHDIVQGNTNEQGFGMFYNATVGYDLTTGWGSPSGTALVGALTPATQKGFQLAASPVDLVLAPGVLSTTTITVNAQGVLSGPVTLSLPNLPNGITATFSTPATSTSSVLTITADSSMARGSFLLPVYGTLNGQTQSIEIAIEVNAPGVYLSGKNPSSNYSPYMWITPGYASSFSMNVTNVAGLSGSAQLSISSPLPNGVTAILNPDTSSGTSTLSFMADNDAPPSYENTIQVTATSGPASDTRPLFLDIFPAQFRVAATPRPTYLTRGSSVDLTVSTMPLGNYAGGTINLNAYTASFPLPSGVTISFNPSTIQYGQTSTMTIAASSTAALGGFGASVVGYTSDPNISPWEAFYVTVVDTPQPTFRVVSNPPYFQLPQGGSFTDTMTLTDVQEISGSTFYLEPPNGDNLQMQIQQPDPATLTGKVVYSASSTASAGLYPATGYAFPASNSSVQGLIDVWVDVTPTTPFSLTTQASPLAITSGGSMSTPVQVTPQNGFSGNVNLSLSGIPEGLTASLDTNQTTGDTTLHIQASSAIASGQYSLNISASASGQTLVRTINVNVGVSAATPTFSIAPGTYASAQTVAISDSTPGATIYYTANGTPPTTSSTPYNGPITVSSSETIEAIATASGYSTSAVASAAYVINPAPVKATPTVTVTPSATSITTAQTLTVTVTVSGGSPTPTGTVTLSGGGYTSAATTLSGGSATITIPAGTFSSGAVSLEASYAGDENYNAAAGSATVTVTTPVNRNFSLGGTSVTVTRGATSGNTATITVTPSGGFTGNVSLTATIASSPSGAQHLPTLSFGSTSPVNISGTNAGTATLTISTIAATSAALQHPKKPGLRRYADGGAVVACVLFFGLCKRRRNWLGTLVITVVSLVVLTGSMIACGSGGGNSGPGGGGTGDPGTTPGSYTITVTGTSGALTTTSAVNLTVQ